MVLRRRKGDVFRPLLQKIHKQQRLRRCARGRLIVSNAVLCLQGRCATLVAFFVKQVDVFIPQSDVAVDRRGGDLGDEEKLATFFLKMANDVENVCVQQIVKGLNGLEMVDDVLETLNSQVDLCLVVLR